MKLIDVSNSLPDSSFSEPAAMLPLPEHMQIATRTELSQEAKPPLTFSHTVQPRQEGMIDHLQYLPLCSSPAFFVPTHQFLLIHYLHGHHASIFATALQLSKIDTADVTRSQSLDEAQIGDGE
jgi:hypothetical protein